MCSDVAELRNKAEHSVLALPQRALVDETGGFLLLLDGRLGDLRELGEAEKNDESKSEAGNAEVDVSVGQAERQQGREGSREGGAVGARKAFERVRRIAYWTAPSEFSFSDPKKVWEAIWGPTKVARPLNCGKRWNQRHRTGSTLARQAVEGTEPTD